MAKELIPEPVPVTPAVTGPELIEPKINESTPERARLAAAIASRLSPEEARKRIEEGTLLDARIPEPRLLPERDTRSPFPVDPIKYPGVLRALADPNVLKLADKDIEKLVVMEATAVEKRDHEPAEVERGEAYDELDQWNRAAVQETVAQLGYRKYILGEQIDENALALAKDELNRIGAKEDPGGLRGFTAQGSYLLRQMGGSALRSTKRALQLGSLAAGTALAIGQSPGLVATPEEVVTVPGAFLGGAGKGLAVGMAEQAFYMEAGLMADELAEIRDDEGNPLPPEIIRGIATAVGGVNAGMEMVGLSKLKNIVTGGLPRQAVKNAMRSKVVQAAIAGAVKRYAQAGVAEAGTEVVQELVNILGTAVAKGFGEHEGQRFEKSVEAPIAPRLWNIAWDTTRGTLAVGFLPGVYSAQRDIRQTAMAKADNAKVDQTIDQVDRLSPELKSSPQAVRAILEQSGNNPRMWAPADALLELRADPKVAKGLDELGIDAGTVSEAARQGQFIGMDLGDVATTFDNASAKSISAISRIEATGRSKNETSASESEIVEGAVAKHEEIIDEEKAFRAEKARIKSEIRKTYQDRGFSPSESKMAAEAATELAAQLDRSFSLRTTGAERVALLERMAVRFSEERTAVDPSMLEQEPEVIPAGDPDAFERRKARGSTAIIDDRYLIRLFDTGEMSTIVHELGHVAIEEMRRFVDTGVASEELAADMGIINTWLGIEEGAEIEREQHEKFARALEAYVMEGKAPSSRLESAFQAFRRWLVELYRNVANLNAAFSDEVRGVFDRLLDAERQIGETMADLDIERLTDADADALKLTKEQQVQYNMAVDRMQQRGTDELLRLRNKSLGAIRTAARKEVTKQLDGRQEYKAISKTKEMGKLDVDDVKMYAGPEQVKQLRAHGIIAKRGDENATDVNLAAAETGYESPEAYIEELGTTPTRTSLINDYINREVENEDGIVTPEEALATERLAAQLDALADYTAQAAKKTESLSERSVIKEAAANQIQGMELQEALHVDRFMGQMQKNLADERSARLREDYEGALTFSKRARANLELARLSRKLRDRHRAIIAKANNVARRKPQRPAAGDDTAFQAVENVKELVNRFQMNRTQRQMDVDQERRKALAEVVNREADEVAQTVNDWSEWLLNETFKPVPIPGRKIQPRAYMRLNSEQFEELADLIDHLDYMRKRAADDSVFGGADTAENMATLLGESVAGLSKSYKPKGPVTKFWRMIQAKATDLLFLFRDADGGVFFKGEGQEGTHVKEIWNRLLEGERRAQEVTDRTTTALKPHLQHLGKAVKRITDTHGKDLKALGVPVPAVWQDSELPGRYQHWTAENVIMLALNMGNAGNRGATALGFGWEIQENGRIAEVDRLTSVMLPEDWDAVQGIWDALGTMWPDLNEVHFRTNGFYAKPVQATPFTTTAGKQLRGGYFPIAADPYVDESAAMQAEREKVRDNDRGMFPSTKTARGMMISRKGSARPLSLTWPVILKHVDRASRYIGVTETIEDSWRVLRNRDYRSAFIAKFGRSFYDEIRPSLAHMARPNAEQLDFFDRTLNYLRNRATIVALFGRMGTAFKQLFSIFGGILDVGAKDLANGYIPFFKDAMQFQGGKMLEKVEMINEKSVFMRKRSAQYDRDINDAANDFDSIGPRRFKRFSDGVIKAGMAGITAFDYMVVYPMWYAAYNQGLQRSGGVEADAITYADRVIQSSQPTLTPLAAPGFQRNKSGWMRAFTMFMTATIRIGMRRRGYWHAFQQGTIDSTRFAKHVGLEWIAAPILMSAMMDAFSGRYDDDNEEDQIADKARRYIANTVSYQFAGIPGVRDLATQMTNMVLGEWWDADRAVNAPPSELVKKAFEGLAAPFQIYRAYADVDDAEAEARAAGKLTEAKQRSLDKTRERRLSAALRHLGDTMDIIVGAPVSRVTRDTIEGVRQYGDLNNHEDNDWENFMVIFSPDPARRGKTRAQQEE